MKRVLSLPGVEPGAEPPATDAEILVSRGHILAARIEALISPRFRRYNFFALVLSGITLIAATCIYVPPPAPSHPYSANFPLPTGRLAVPFSKVKYPVLPSASARDIKLISAAYSRAMGNKPVPAGISSQQAYALISDLFAWYSATPQNESLVKTAPNAAKFGFPANSTITLNAKFLSQMTSSSLAGGMIGIPKSSLYSSGLASTRVFTNLNPTHGPYDFAAIINHEFGFYVLGITNYGQVTCQTIAGPSIAQLCPEGSESYVNQSFAKSGPYYATSLNELNFAARHIVPPSPPFHPVSK